MTREELIKAIYDNEDTLSCPEYACDMPEKEGNTGKCCLRCAEKQLKAYEDKIRAEAINEVFKKLYDIRDSLPFKYSEHWTSRDSDAISALFIEYEKQM